MNDPDTTIGPTANDPNPMPSSGGRYIRRADGTLERWREPGPETSGDREAGTTDTANSRARGRKE